LLAIEHLYDERTVKHDRWKSILWPDEHWMIAKCICVCIVVIALVLTATGIMTGTAAFVAALLAVVYVLLLTRRYTGRSRNRHF